MTLFSSTFASPLGPLLAIGDEAHLHALTFINSKHNALTQKRYGHIPKGTNPILRAIEQELVHYFAGTLKTFQTPIRYHGTPFQTQVWHTLCQIPYGDTWSYTEEALAMGRPSAHRAVANANGQNPISIIIPCHRVIRQGGGLGGYGGGLDKKTWLLAHEQKHKK